MTPKSNQGTLRAALITVQVLFGINYLASKFIVSSLSPGAWAALRTSGAFLVLLAVMLIKRPGLPSFRDMGLLGFGAFFGIVLNQGLFLEGLARTTVSRSALICSQIPTFVLLFSVLSKQEKLSPAKALGFLAGISGVMVLLEVDKFKLDSQYLAGDLMTLANAASFALFVVMSRHIMARNNALSATTVVFFFGTLGMMSYGGRDLFATNPDLFTLPIIGAMVFVILGATVLTYFLNLWAVKRTHASRVAIYIFLQPLIASVLGFTFRDEVISGRFILATVLVFIALTLRDRGKPKSSEKH